MFVVVSNLNQYFIMRKKIYSKGILPNSEYTIILQVDFFTPSNLSTSVPLLKPTLHMNNTKYYWHKYQTILTLFDNSQTML